MSYERECILTLFICSMVLAFGAGILTYRWQQARDEVILLQEEVNQLRNLDAALLDPVL